ncbi:MAG: hypothetical protein MZW92_24985 [Comamonadaceae bacterium]|nr:hypothetical protein [Comamonadaceae bacterium]
MLADLPGGPTTCRTTSDVIINRRGRRADDLLGLTFGGGASAAPQRAAVATQPRRRVLTSNFAEAGGFVRSPRPGSTAPDLQLHFVVGMVDKPRPRRRQGSRHELRHICFAAAALARHGATGLRPTPLRRAADRPAASWRTSRRRAACWSAASSSCAHLRAAGASRRVRAGPLARHGLCRGVEDRRRDPRRASAAPRRHDLPPGRNLPHGLGRDAPWSTRSCACADVAGPARGRTASVDTHAGRAATPTRRR